VKAVRALRVVAAGQGDVTRQGSSSQLVPAAAAAGWGPRPARNAACDADSEGNRSANLYDREQGDRQRDDRRRAPGDQRRCRF